MNAVNVERWSHKRDNHTNTWNGIYYKNIAVLQ